LRRVTGIPQGVIAIDGKTSRRSGLKNKGKAAIHMVSAFACAQASRTRSGQVTEKSNESLHSKLLDLLDDRRRDCHHRRHGCQREIAQKIIDKKPITSWP